MTPGSYLLSRIVHTGLGKKKEFEAIIAVITTPKVLIVFFTGNVSECVSITQQNESKAALIMTKEDRREEHKKVSSCGCLTTHRKEKRLCRLFGGVTEPNFGRGRAILVKILDP